MKYGADLFFYIVKSDHFLELKFGITNDLSKRIETYNRSLPMPIFQYAFYERNEYADKIELILIKKYQSRGINTKREWVKIGLPELISDYHDAKYQVNEKLKDRQVSLQCIINEKDECLIKYHGKLIAVFDTFDDMRDVLKFHCEYSVLRTLKQWIPGIEFDVTANYKNVFHLLIYQQ